MELIDNDLEHVWSTQKDEGTQKLKSAEQFYRASVRNNHFS